MLAFNGADYTEIVPGWLHSAAANIRCVSPTFAAVFLDFGDWINERYRHTILGVTIKFIDAIKQR